MKQVRISAMILAFAALAAAASGQAQAAQGDHHSALFERLCSHPSEPSRHHKLGERLAGYLDLNDAQKAAYNEFKEARLKAAAERKAAMQFEPMPTGRPSKRDRRKIIQFRGRG